MRNLNFLLSLIFLFLLELPLLVYEGSFWLFAIALIFAPTVCWYLLRRINLSVISGLLSLAAILLIQLSSNDGFIQTVVVVSSLLFYLLLLIAGKQRYHEVIIISFIEFLVYLFLILSSQTFFNISLWFVLPAVFAVSSILFFASLTTILDLGFWLKFRLGTFSLIVGFLIAEFYLYLSKLPFNVMSIDFILFIIYYVLWDIAYRYFALQFTKRSLLINVLTLIIGFGLIIFSVKWFPS